jgi:hypothetical protein
MSLFRLFLLNAARPGLPAFSWYYIEMGRAGFLGLGLGSGFILCAWVFSGLKNSLNKLGFSHARSRAILNR